MRRIRIFIVAAAVLVAGPLPAAAPAADAAKAAVVPAEPASPGRAPAKKASTTPKKKLVNLNAASAAELKALPGGSDEEAARIIAGRPYDSKAFLVSNKVISDGRYSMIRNLIVAGEPAKAAAPKK